MAMTVRLPDELVCEAKKFGEKRGVPSLNALIAIALREYLYSRGVRFASDRSELSSAAEVLRGERAAHPGYPMQQLEEATVRSVALVKDERRRSRKKR